MSAQVAGPVWLMPKKNVILNEGVDANKQVVLSVGSKNVEIPVQYGFWAIRIFQDFCDTHSISDDGTIVDGTSGEKITSEPEKIAAFYRYISVNPIAASYPVKARCNKCHGSGVKIIYHLATENVASLIERANCDSCNGAGSEDVTINFMMICPAWNVPDAPKTPGELKQERLIKLANEGNEDAQLKLALALIQGTIKSGKDIPRAEKILVKLVCGSNKQAFGLYCDLKTKNALPVTDKELLWASVLETAQKIINNSSADSPGHSIKLRDFSDEIAARVLAQKFSKLFYSKELTELDFSLSNLSKKSVTKNYLGNDLEVAVDDWLKSGGNEIGGTILQKIKVEAGKLNPEAFELLSAIAERGLSEKARPDAAYIYKHCAQKIRGQEVDVNITSGLSGDQKLIYDVIFEQFTLALSERTCPSTLIDAIWELLPR